MKVPKRDFTPREKEAFLEFSKQVATISNASEFFLLTTSLVEWESDRYKVDGLLPAIVLDKRLVNSRGQELLAGFLPMGEVPTMHVSLSHPTLRAEPAQLAMNVFHEFHHFLSWKKDPSAFEREKGLPPDHPIEQEYELKALDDFTAFIKERARGTG